MYQDIDLKALFIGDKAENGDLYKAIMDKLLDEHFGWRENYMPADLAAIKHKDTQKESYIATKERIIEVLEELSQRMRSGSIPWSSAGRYWGHMNSETLLPSLLAYSFASLWNPNNVALESSMATSKMEGEVGEDFARLFGFKEGWGHICADGSLANLEGLWYARCFKSIPLAIKELYPNKVEGMSDWELLNLNVDQIIDYAKELTPDELDNVKNASSRSGKNIDKLGKWLVPQTKHYSWLKALDISGVGIDQMESIPIKTNYRMDIDLLEDRIRELTSKKTPILGVVAVVGSTEEGAVDEVHKIVELRKKLEKEGITFYLHVDAAYGGYGRALFLDEESNFIPYENLEEEFKKYDVFNYPVKISEDVYNGYKGIEEADYVTIDPHKMGYIPYSAGGVVIRKKAMRNIISYFASYVFEKNLDLPDMLGAYILEGSKAGATAATVWTAHQVLPLNIAGYGRLIGSSIESAQRFRDFLDNLSFEIKGKTIEVYPLNHPDFNMVDWSLKEKGCTDLAKINDLNEKMYDYASYLDGNVYSNRFITSHTIFDSADYGNSPLGFVKGMGVSEEEWKKVHAVNLLRASIMTPYLNNDKLFEYYTKNIKEAMKQKLEEIYEHM